MRVLIVHTPSRRSLTGEDLAARQQLLALREAGNDVEEYPGDEAGISAAGYLRGTTPDFADVILRFDPEVIHLHKWYPSLGRNDFEALGNRAIATLHNFRPLCPVGTLFREGRLCVECVDRLPWPAVAHNCHSSGRLHSVAASIARPMPGREHPFLHRVARYIAPSDRTAAMFHDLGGVPRDRIDIIPSFVDPPSASPADNSQRKGLLFVGQLEETKGVRQLVRHLPPEEELAIVGSGVLEPQLKAAAKGKLVAFLGAVGRDDVLRLMSTAEAVVFPSSYLETQGLVVGEAAATGTPVIALAGTAGADQVAAYGFGVVLDDMAELPAGIAEVRSRSDVFRCAGEKYHQTVLSKAVWLNSVAGSYGLVANR